MPFDTVLVPNTWTSVVQRLFEYTAYDTVPRAFAVTPDNVAWSVTAVPDGTDPPGVRLVITDGATLVRVTVIETVATFESTLVSFALNVKLSGPEYPVAG